MERLEKVRHTVDYYLPREVTGPFLIIFAAENVTEILFEQYLGGVPDLVGWLVVLVIFTIVVGYWGEVDEDKEELESKIND